MGSFCVCEINHMRHGSGNALKRKYQYSNHHIEVNLGVIRYGVCGSSHYDSENMQFIRLQMKGLMMIFTGW